MARVVFADDQDDVTSLRTKLESVDGEHVAIAIPSDNRGLVNPIAVRLLRRGAEALALELSLITTDPALKRISRDEGVPTFRSPRSFRHHYDPGARPIGRLAEAIASLPSRAGTFAATATVVALVAVGLGLLYVFLPSATVTLTPQTAAISGTVEVQADPGIRAIDFKALQVPARVVYLLVEASDQANSGGERPLGEARAVGAVTFTNRSSEQITVPQGTIVSTADGIRFNTDEEVKVAAGLGQTARARITAVQTGSSANVARLKISKVEGNLQYYVNVLNEEPTAGGGIQSTPVVTTADQDRLKTRVLDSARKEALARLAAEPKGREQLVEQSVEFTPLEVTFDHEVGQEAKVLNVHIKARAGGTIVNMDDVNAVALQGWKPTVQADYELSPEGIKTSPPQFVKMNDKVVVLSVKLDAVTMARINEERVRQYVRWRSPDQAAQELSQVFDLAAKPTIRIDPSWASTAYRVQVVLNVGTPSAAAP